jgi:hypothetical protein
MTSYQFQSSLYRTERDMLDAIVAADLSSLTASGEIDASLRLASSPAQPDMPKDETRTCHLHIRTKPSIGSALVAAANERERSVSWLVEHILAGWLQEADVPVRVQGQESPRRSARKNRPVS